MLLAHVLFVHHHSSNAISSSSASLGNTGSYFRFHLVNCQKAIADQGSYHLPKLDIISGDAILMRLVAVGGISCGPINKFISRPMARGTFQITKHPSGQITFKGRLRAVFVYGSIWEVGFLPAIAMSKSSSVSVNLRHPKRHQICGTRSVCTYLISWRKCDKLRQRTCKSTSNFS